MAGVRIGGSAASVALSPPYTFVNTDSKYNVWRVVNGAPTNVTADTEDSDRSDPMISPDGTTIVYVQENDDAFTDLYTIPAAGGTPTLLDSSSTQFLLSPYWHPNSNKIVYVQGIDELNGGEVCSINADGTGKTVLFTPTPVVGQNVMAVRPQYNRDGTLIVFWQTTHSIGDGLWVMNDDGSSPSEIVATVAYGFQGSQFAFANLSDRIVYWDGDDGITTGKLWCIDSDGSNQVQINDTQDGETCNVGKFSWSPDDQYVFGRSWDGLDWYVYRFPADGSGSEIKMDAGGGAPPMWFNLSGNSSPFYKNNRLYYIQEDREALVSVAADNSSWQVEHDVTADDGIFATTAGTGFEHL